MGQQMFRWGAYTNISNMFRDDKGKISVIGNTISGLGAGVVEAVCAVTPVETVKTRVNDDMRRGSGNYKGSGDAIVKIMKTEGPVGLYRGALPTILKQACNQAVRMPLQLQFFTMISFGDESKKKSPIYNGIAGAMAGVGSVFLTQPQDCVKSRMQGEQAKELYKGTLDCAMTMFRTEGPTVFFRRRRAAQHPNGCQRRAYFCHLPHGWPAAGHGLAVDCRRARLVKACRYPWSVVLQKAGLWCREA